MKIAVCVPVHRENKADFTLSLARMLVRSASELELEVFFKSSSIVAYGRNELVSMARNWGADYILWADDDHIFPPEALLRLLRHRKPVIGCNFVRRAAPHLSVASKSGKMVWTTRAKAESGYIEEVDTLGLGLCLMAVPVLNGLESPLFTIDLTTMSGEDTLLCRKLRAASVTIHVDHGLSWECRHIADVGLGFQLLQGETANVGSALSTPGDQ